MPDNQIADTEMDTQADDEVDTVLETTREEQLRALAAIHGGLGDDLLPGVAPFVDDDLFGGREWPHGWVAA
jgi:hypothetical protein